MVKEQISEQNGVFISTYGCQMNVNDSERMQSLLEMSNYVQVSSPEEASLIIINSCSVREKPVHKVHSEVGRYRKLKALNPDLRIGVGGCVGQQEKDRLLKDLPLLDFVFGPDNIDELPALVESVKPLGRRTMGAKFKYKEGYHISTLIRNTSVTAFVNITKGCDNFCTFCVVPYTRGRERSRPLQDIVNDLNELANRGVKEVTLLGQNVNSYTSENGENFSALLRAVCEQTTVERIRYTTSHPKDFDEELADVMHAYRERLCDYIHLPFQSGNTEVLARMNRGYSREDYLAKLQMIKKRVPNVSLSTDIIVGFPGETEEQFQDTLSLVEEVGFDTIFAFMYSPRPFTKAAKFTDQIPDDVKSERLQRLFDFHENLAGQLAERFLQQTLDVLVEGYDEDRGNLKGRSVHNKLVYFVGPKDLIGQTVPVKITKAFPSVLRGELVGTC